MRNLLTTTREKPVSNKDPVQQIINEWINKIIFKKECFAEELAFGHHLEGWLLVCRIGMKEWDTHQRHSDGLFGRWVQCDLSRDDLVEVKGGQWSERRWEASKMHKPQFFRGSLELLVTQMPFKCGPLFSGLPWPRLTIRHFILSFICKL